MIPYIPQIYEDELIYSYLARFYVKSGYTTYTDIAKLLYNDAHVRPDVDFLNAYTDFAKSILLRDQSVDDVIMKHTMFPFYGRFSEYNRRNASYKRLALLNSNRNNVPLPKRKSESRHLRYCPMCVREDRERYGETYWHRIHQVVEINVCAIHSCNLIAGDIEVSGKVSPNLETAELNAEKTSCVKICDDDTKIRLSRYVSAVGLSNPDLVNRVSVGDFLSYKVKDTKYMQGKQRKITLLYNDFMKYYESLENNRFNESWQLEKVFTRDRTNIVEVCMLAMFLNIPPNELCDMHMPGNRCTAEKKRVGNVGGGKKVDWERIDNETLPLVWEVISELKSAPGRPQKITKNKIEKMLGLPSKRIDYLPKCKRLIDENHLTQNGYRAIEITWAAKHLIDNNITFNLKHLRNLTNIRKTDLISCLSYIDDKDIREKIEGVL